MSNTNQDGQEKKPLPIYINPQIDLERMHADVEAMFKSMERSNGVFNMMRCSEWLEQASKRPIPQMLFSEFWYEGELCILFADTNTGKSILAVQIADSISKGYPIPGHKLGAPAQPVIYFDFELFDKQFEARYSDNYTQHYSFHPNIYRAELDPEAELPEHYETFEEYLHYSLERAIHNAQARILVIDNLTYLKNETERAKDALPLMKHLKALKKKYDLSILTLAHTPKRDLSKPITRNDLQGSKMLINFCDSSFCIGESQGDASLRYLKQIKTRNTEQIYGTDNVCLCRIEKPHNFLQFTAAGYGNERQHLKETSDDDKGMLIAEIKRLNDEGLTQREIAAELGVSVSTVNKYIHA